MADEVAIIRANAAKQELRETGAAFDAVREALMRKWSNSPAEATQTRETCFFMISALDQVRDMLGQVIVGGDVEALADELANKPKGA